MHSLADVLPPARLELRTPRLSLRLPSPEELVRLGEVAVAGIHSGDVCPFADPWSRGPAEAVRRTVVQRSLHAWAAAAPGVWELPFGVFDSSGPIGVQTVTMGTGGVPREGFTRSWLGLASQGRGYGVEMRAAVLELAFLAGAKRMTSTYSAGSHASAAVSERCGYLIEDTFTETTVDGVRVKHRAVMSGERWPSCRSSLPSVHVFGFDAGVAAFLHGPIVEQSVDRAWGRQAAS